MIKYLIPIVSFGCEEQTQKKKLKKNKLLDWIQCLIPMEFVIIRNKILNFICYKIFIIILFFY